MSLSIAGMVYAEVVLKRRLDWRTLSCKLGGSMSILATKDILQTRLFQGDALRKKISKVEILDVEVEHPLQAMIPKVDARQRLGGSVWTERTQGDCLIESSTRWLLASVNVIMMHQT